MTTKLDFSKLDDPRITELLAMEVLMIDEYSMIDEPAWNTIAALLSSIDHTRRPNDTNASVLGNMHILMFGNFKQLPPATSKGDCV